MLHDHFDVAHLVGHTAFDHLAEAMNAHKAGKAAALLDPDQYDWPMCLELGGKLSVLRKAEHRSCIQAVILFQAMMEKVPFFLLSIGPNLAPPTHPGFANSWRDLLSQIRDPASKSAAQTAFKAYDDGFYKAFRNPIVHGKEQSDIVAVNAIRTPGVYQGMLSGWRAYDYLLTEAFAPSQTHEPSWASMCGTHRIPETIAESDYPDLDALEARFNKKHLDGARAAMGNPG